MCSEENHGAEYRQMYVRGDTTPEGYFLPNRYMLVSNWKIFKSISDQLFGSALLMPCTGNQIAFLNCSSIDRQYAVDIRASQFQTISTKKVVGIHDKNSVTERVSKSVHMLLPVKMNTWK